MCIRNSWLATILGIACLLCSDIVHARSIPVDGRDSQAIGQAVAQSVAGDEIMLPEGKTVIQEAIHPKSGTVIKGAGQDKTTVVFQGKTPSEMVNLSGLQDVEIADLTLDGENNPSVTQGITAGSAKGLKVHHVTIRNLAKGCGFGPHGVLFSGTNPTRENGVTDSEIVACRFENIGVGADFGGGIRLSWGSSRNKVVGNTIINTGRGGIFADNGSMDNLIRANTVEGSQGEGLGIEVWGESDRSVIEDNRIDHWLSVGGSHYCAVRRNTIAGKSGEYKFCGIEGIGSYCIFTDNVVNGGQQIGLSVSSTVKKDHVYWARNTIRDCNQWGAQFQGESTGLAYHYLYRCSFTEMPIGEGTPWYPGDEGHGFRINGNARHMTFEECTFSENGRSGLQFVGTNIDGLTFLRCTIQHNKGTAATNLGGYSALEWLDCSVKGNAADTLPPAKPSPARPPKANVEGPHRVRVGTSAEFRCNSSEPAAVLWDLGDGPPLSGTAVSHAYGVAGEYLIAAIVWDSAGRATRIEHEVRVE